MKESNIVVSVIIPCYNGEKYIQKCVDSLLHQDYDKGYEVIVVNDGSKDGTKDILDSFTDSKVVCFHNENRGVAITRRFGAENARGKYLMFVDADDWVSTNYISKMVSQVSDNYIPFCRFRKMYKDREEDISLVAPGKYPYAQTLNLIVNAKMMATYWRTIFEKEKFLSIEMNTLKYCEDAVYIMEYLSKYELGVNLLEDVLYFYNLYNENSATNNFYTIKYLDSFLRIPFLLEKVFYERRDIIDYQKHLSIVIVLSMTRSFRIVDYKSFKRIFNDSKYDVYRKIPLNKCDRYPHKVYFMFFKMKFYLPIYFIEYLFRRDKNKRKKTKYEA